MKYQRKKMNERKREREREKEKQVKRKKKKKKKKNAPSIPTLEVGRKKERKECK